MEHGLEAVLAAETQRCVRGVLPDIGGVQSDDTPGADVRQHHGSCSCLGRRRRRGQQNQALARSRGGFSTKIHLKSDFDGQLLAFHLIGGEANDSPQFPLLLGIGPDIKPRAVLTDKGYDAKSNRRAAWALEIVPVIPVRKITLHSPKRFPRLLHKARTRIEQAVGKLKRSKRVALGCGKTKQNYESIVAFVCALILVNSVRQGLACGCRQATGHV